MGPTCHSREEGETLEGVQEVRSAADRLTACMNRLAQGAQDTCMYTDRWRPELSRNNFAVENKFEPPPLPPLFPDSHPNPELVVPLCVVDLPRDQEVHPHIDALLQCRLRGKIDNNGVISAFLEERINVGVNFLVWGEIDHTKRDYKFGVGMTVGA